MDMSIFSRFSKAKPQDSLSTSKSFFWGNSSSGTYVNENTALQTAAVYACVRVLSEALASLPLNVYKYEGKSREFAHDHKLYYLLHNEPNDEMTSFIFRETLMSHLLIYGNAYAQIIRDNAGNVKSLYPLLPNKIDVNRDKNGQLFYTYWRDYDEAKSTEKTGGVTLDKSEILHISGLSFNGLVGYSPIALAKDSIGLLRATEEYGAGFFANSANPSGILEHPESLKNPDLIKQTWNSLYRGSSKSHGLAVLEEGMKFHPISIPPEQAQFLETRKYQLNEICRIFRVPPHLIGDLEKATFSNIEQQGIEFLQYSIEPWLVRWEQAMCKSLLLSSEKSKYFIKFNVDGLLRGDYETRMKGYAVGRQNGWLSANDIRRLENMNEIPAVEGGDDFLVNGNMLKISDAGKFYGKRADYDS
jgi:HK97 family phage portal protein